MRSGRPTGPRCRGPESSSRPSPLTYGRGGVSSPADGAAPARLPVHEVPPRMVKRARGSVRPGQRRPIDRRPASPAAAPTTQRSGGLSDAELARAAELESQLLAEERAAESARKRTAERSTREAAPTRVLAFEDEYAYVARDVKDIVRIAIVLIGLLIALYLIVDVLDVVKVG